MMIRTPGIHLRNCIRGMEGIVRRALASNPDMDVVMIHFPNEGMLATIDTGDEPIASGQHEAVASPLWSGIRQCRPIFGSGD